MLKFGGGAAPGDEPLFVMGLTRRNVDALVAGRPIMVAPEQVELITGRAVRVGIVFGETDQHLVGQIRAAGIELPPGVEEAIRATRRPGESTL